MMRISIAITMMNSTNITAANAVGRTSSLKSAALSTGTMLDDDFGSETVRVLLAYMSPSDGSEGKK